MKDRRPRVARPVGVVAVAALVATAATWGFGSPAFAVAPDVYGWWTQANPGNVIPTLLGPTAALPPDVPPDGMLVEGPAEGPLAMAALSYTVPDGFTASILVLSVAPDSHTVPESALQLCALRGPTFDAAQGGPMDEAPEWDCSLSSPGVADEAGSSWSFSVTALLDGDRLRVAVLPIGETDRIVLSRPTVDSLPLEPVEDDGDVDDESFDGLMFPGSEPTVDDTGGYEAFAVPDIPTAVEPVLAPTVAPTVPRAPASTSDRSLVSFSPGLPSPAAVSLGPVIGTLLVLAMALTGWMRGRWGAAR